MNPKKLAHLAAGVMAVAKVAVKAAIDTDVATLVTVSKDHSDEAFVVDAQSLSDLVNKHSAQNVARIEELQLRGLSSYVTFADAIQAELNKELSFHKFAFRPEATYKVAITILEQTLGVNIYFWSTKDQVGCLSFVVYEQPNGEFELVLSAEQTVANGGARNWISATVKKDTEIGSEERLNEGPLHEIVITMKRLLKIPAVHAAFFG